MLDTIGAILAGILVCGFFGGLCYVMLFKAGSSNYPLAIRGTGVMLLAGILKVVCVVLALDVSDVFDAAWINYVLGAVAAGGFFMMTAGFGAGPR
jgi:hypothetical protein